MDPWLELPDLPQNAVMLNYLRGQASPPGGPDDWALGSWQLHAHADLVDVLRGLAPGWPLTAAYGVPLLSWDGVAAVVAVGTDWLALRLDDLPAGVETDRDTYGESLPIGPGWHVVPIWEGRLAGRVGLLAESCVHVADFVDGQAGQRLVVAVRVCAPAGARLVARASTAAAATRGCRPGRVSIRRMGAFG